MKPRLSVAFALVLSHTFLSQLPADDLPTVDAVLDRHVEALGGEKELRRNDSIRITGRVEIAEAGLNAICTVYRKAPAKSRIVVDVDAGKYIDVFNGEKGKKGMEADGLKDKTDVEIRIDKRTKPYFRSLSFKSFYVELKVTGIEPVDGRDGIVIAAMTTDGKTDELVFDKETHFLIQERIEKDASSRIGFRAISTHSDYRTVQGVKSPFKTSTIINSLSSPIIFTATEFHIGEKLSDDLWRVD